MYCIFCQVEDLEFKLEDAADEHKRLDEENRSMISKLDERETRYANTEDKLKKEIDKKEDKLKRVTRRNQELDMDIEDCERKSHTL